MRIHPNVELVVKQSYPATEQEHARQHRQPAAVQVQPADESVSRGTVYGGRLVEVLLIKFIAGEVQWLAWPQGPGHDARHGRLDKLPRAPETDLLGRPLDDDRHAVDLADPPHHIAGRAG